jgi:hypothetical protein
MMVAVDTQAEPTEVEALQVDLDSALTHINVSSPSNLVCSSLYLIDSLLQKIINFSRGKDKILKASLSRIHEAWDHEDELSQERKANQALLSQLKELTSQLEAERLEKSGKPLRIHFTIIFMLEQTLR